MTVKEFEKQNSDILLQRMTDSDFQELTDGMVFFCITTTVGSKPVNERAVICAGYNMVVASTTTTFGGNSKLEDVVTLALTKGGYAKIDVITPALMSESGNKVLYKCRPLPKGDPRKSHHWLPRRES